MQVMVYVQGVYNSRHTVTKIGRLCHTHIKAVATLSYWSGNTFGMTGQEDEGQSAPKYDPTDRQFCLSANTPRGSPIRLGTCLQWGYPMIEAFHDHNLLPDC